MFHITNGEHANEMLMAARIEGDFLAWDDVLHEGPVPAGLSLHELSLIRSRFISFCGWATEFEAQTHFQTRDARFLDAARNRSVVIWNSHELFDQLHLLQLLSWYSSQPALTPPRIVFIEALLGASEQTPAQLAKLLAAAGPATPAQLQQADQLWQLFTAPNPRALASVSEADCAEFPFMYAGIQRLLQEYPDSNGVSRTERAALQAVAAGADSPVAMFQAVRDAEAVPFMGDASFWQIVNQLCSDDQPLLKTASGAPFELPDIFAPGESFRAQKLQLTEAGQQVLAGQGNWLEHHAIDRWIGGVHLNPESRWLWADGEFSRF